MAQSEYRVYGPYRHRDGWRVVVVGPTGRRKTAGARTRRKALEIVKSFRRKMRGRVTICKTLELYEKHQRAKGNKSNSIAHNLWRLRVWLDDEGQAVAKVTPKQMRRKYEVRSAKLAAASHQGELAVVKTFWRWVVEQGFVRRSPAEDIKPVGRRRHGKAQLRKSEAQTFAAQAMLMYRAGDEGALAALSVLQLGIRTSELVERRVRDVDVTEEEVFDEERGEMVTRQMVLLWIDEGKTNSASRHMEVPEPVGSLLVAQAGNREPQDWLWPSAKSASGHRERTWMLKAVKRVCRAAGVLVTCTHGLRGTWSSLTTDAGVSAHVVARELGHARPSVTRECYIAPGTEARARARGLRLVKVGN